MDELSQTQLNHLNAQLLFEGHQQEALSIHFPQRLLFDIQTDPLIEGRCSNPFIYFPLCSCLSFGRTLDRKQLLFLVGRFRQSRLISNARTQLLYWYLARAHANPLGPLVTHLAIYYKADQFWFNYIATHHAQIINQLLDQRPAYFLRHFSLTHTHLELDVGELRLVTNRTETLPYLPEV